MIQVQKRDGQGTGSARASRLEGLLPAVVYGGNAQPVHILVNQKDLETAMNKSGFFTNLFDINVEGKNIKVLTKDVQLHPVTDRPLHVDFLRVDQNTKLTIAVPVTFINQATCPGIKLGGILNVVTPEIHIVCSPDKIPHSIQIDLSSLKIGDNIHASDLKLPEGVSAFKGHGDETIAVILAPKDEKAEAPVAAAAAAAPAAAAGGKAPAAAKPAAKPAAKK